MKPLYAGRRMTAAEFARRYGLSKAGMSRAIAAGLPVALGRDEHGRRCKFVDPATAHAWVAARRSATSAADGANISRAVAEVRTAKNALRRAERAVALLLAGPDDSKDLQSREANSMHNESHRGWAEFGKVLECHGCPGSAHAVRRAAAAGFAPEEVSAVVFAGVDPVGDYPKLIFGGWARHEAFVAVSPQGIRHHAPGDRV